MKILYVIGSLNHGGAERQLYLLAKGVTQLGYDVHVFALDASGALKQDFLREGIVVVGGGFDGGAKSRFRSYLSLLLSFFRLIHYVVRKKFHIVHGFLPLTNFMACLAGRATGARVVTSRRGLGTHQDRGFVWRWMDRIANGLSHIVTVNSLGVWEDVVARDSINPKKLRLIYNGLDFERFDRICHDKATFRDEMKVNEGDIAIVNVANLIPYKGHETLIKAFSIASRQAKHLRLFLVGEDRGIGESLVRLSDELGMTELISFVGYQKQPEKYLVASDISIVSSFEEGFSNFLIESMYAKNFAIATTVGGNSEAIVNGAFGILVPPGDDIEMAKAILRVCEDRVYRENISEASNAEVRGKYTVENMVNAYNDAYLSKN